MTQASLRSAEIRKARADLKRDLRARKVHLAAVISKPPDYAKDMDLALVLGACRGMGRSALRCVWTRLDLSPFVTLGELTPRRRAEILLFCREHFPRLGKHLVLNGRRL